MRLEDAYRIQKTVCYKRGIQCDLYGHYKTRIDFKGESVYVSPDGSDVVRYKFDITGCLKTRTIKKDGKVVKVLHFHKDKLPVYGTITRQKKLRGFLYKYILFLRCDGIEDKDLIKLYVLYCLADKFEFWRKDRVKYKDWELYSPDYQDVEVMIDALICSAMKKKIDDQTREQFIVRSCCVVNPEARDERGGIWNKRNCEKHWDAKRGQRKATDNRIKSLYDPTLKDKENAEKIGICLRRFQEWKADNVESPQDRIKRLYDPGKSVSENAAICGVSESSIHRYKRILPVKEETEDSWIEDYLDRNDLYKEDSPRPKKQIVDDDMEELLREIDKMDL